MTYGSIYESIIYQIYGDTSPPVSMYERLHGSDGIIARKRQQLMEKEDLWFMEAQREIYVAEGENQYDLHFGFKKEFEEGLRFSDPYTGDYYSPLKKVSKDLVDDVYRDYDQTANIPWHYYIDYSTSYKRLTVLPKPSSFNDTVELSTASTAEQVANTAFEYVIDGTKYEKAAADNTFTANDTINTGAAAGTYWGIWLFQINSSGAISTKPGGGLDDQVYTSKLNAINALPQADSENWPVGYVAVESSSGSAWTANTDDLTEGSDATSVNYYNITSILNMRYWKFLDDLSDTNTTFDAYEDNISIECADFLIWTCVKALCHARRDFELLQLANAEIQTEFNKIVDKNFRYKKTNKRIPYGNL